MQRDYLAFGAALVLLTAVAARAYGSIDAAEQTLGWVEHTGHVAQQMEQLSAAYSRAVSARRAYIVAGDASQLAETTDLDARTEALLSNLRASMSDNPLQAARVDRFGGLVRQRILDLDASVEERRRTGSSADTSATLALSGRIRTAREEMEQEESRLQAERDARTRADLSRTKTAVVAGTLSSFAILLTAFQLLRQENARRRAFERFLDSIVENLPNMVFVKDAAELRFQRINRAGERLLGLERASLLGKTDYDFFPREQADAFRARDLETLSGQKVGDVVEEPIQTKAGERWLHTRTVPVLGETGKPAFLLGISEDITEQRASARALRKAKEDTEAANRELEAFSYSVAHDLRAPLRGINGFSAALLEDYGDKLEGEASEHLGRIVAGADRMGHLIDALLSLARLTRAELHREPVDLAKVTRAVFAQLSASDPAREVELKAPASVMATCDAQLLRVVLENVIGNAWKFTRKRPKATIELGTEDHGGVPVYFVRDDGAGFDMALADKLFAPFRRLHRDVDFEGSGIGLATVQRIVRRHGGRVWADGREGHGATLWFTLSGDVREDGGVAWGP